MPRNLRVELSGAIYHVISRGDRRDAIHYEDVDGVGLREDPAEVWLKTGLEAGACNLMANDFNLG